MQKLAPGTKLVVREWELGGEPVVQVQADALFAGEVAERSQGRAAANFTKRGAAAVDQRCAGGSAAERRPGFRAASCLDESDGTSWPTYTVGYGSSFADDELTDAEQKRRRCWVRSMRGSWISRRPSSRLCRRLLPRWKSLSRRLRSFRCISCANVRGRTSRSD